MTTLFNDAMAEHKTGVAVEEANEPEVRGVLDSRAQEYLGISGDEFLANLSAGEYSDVDTGDVQTLKGIASLLG